MAGGKETPRQKLIGLMYLVLLALLALQIGAEIMLKFQQLNDSLTNFVAETQGKSSDILSNIGEKVKERGNKPAEVKALEDANSLHAKSGELIGWIASVKKELVEITGGRDPETQVPIGMKDADKTSKLLVGAGNKKGKAYELKTKLNDYIVYLNETSKSIAKATGGSAKEYPKLALDGKEDPLFYDLEKKKEKVEGAKTKDFAHLNFDHTPMIASMAFLTEKQSKVAAYEAEIMAKMKTLVGAADFKFDQVLAVVKPVSQNVAAGTFYEAEMFMSATSSSILPTMTSSVGAVKMNGATGSIKFKASSASYDKDGKAKKSWTGNITIPQPTGGDTTLTIKTEYTVTKPVIQVQAASIAALYRNCGNTLNILVPALGAEYDPKFLVKGGSQVKGKKTGEITIYPTGKQVAITVQNGGSTIGTEKFKVRSIPNPTILVMPNGKKMTASMEKQGMPAPGPRSVKMVAKSDPSFAATLPNEANYKVSKWTATLVRGRRPVGGAIPFSSTTGNLSAMRSKAKPGDRILLEVKEVVRINSKKRREKVPVGLVIRNIPLA